MSDERWIVVRNWDEFQHYKDRTVPWIKFYAELLHDDEWLNLPPRPRSLLCGIWLLYMSSRCALRALPRRLSGALNQQVTRSDLERLVQAGFITIESRPRLEHVQMAARPTRARKEQEAEEEKKELPSSTPPQEQNDLPFELELAATRLLKVVGEASDNGTRATLERYGLPPAAWYAAAEELERMGPSIRNRGAYASQLFKTWKTEGRYTRHPA